MGSAREGRIRDEHQRVALVAEILRRYGREIRAMIRFAGFGPEESEDAYQEVFLALLTTPPPEDVRDMRAYLYRIILNDAISRSTSRRVHHRHLGLYAAHLRYMLEQRDPSEVLADQELLERTRGLMQDLPPRQAMAVSMAFEGRIERGQLCEILGIKRQSFAKSLWRGLRVLRANLRERTGEHEADS